MPTSVRKYFNQIAQIVESTSWLNCPEAACKKTVDALVDVLGCNSACIYLMDLSNDYLVVSATLDERYERFMRFPITTGRTMQMMKSHQPAVMDFKHPHPDDEGPINIEYRSAISVPLLASNEMLGIYIIFYKDYHRWTKLDIECLLIIGRLLGISVQNYYTARKTMDLEILLERKRLSGELHDNLSEMIYSLNLAADAAHLSWEEGKTDQLKRDIERISLSSHKAVQTLREEMLSLRTPISESLGLIHGIKDLLIRFEKQWGIETNLQVGQGLEQLVVSTQMELQLMRILHEALSNILRHATASQINVLIQSDQNHLIMQICDNGRGFDPEAIPSERLGLRIMRERAESLDGKITIGTGKDIGTTIRIEVPYYSGDWNT